MATAAVAGRSGVNVEGYRDYRGVKVVGAWTWDDELHFAMATEMDYAEAYGPYHNVRRLLLLGLSLIVGLFVSLTAILNTGQARAVHLANQMTLALQDSEHRYRSLVQTAGNVIVYLSPEHRNLGVQRRGGTCPRSTTRRGFGGRLLSAVRTRAFSRAVLVGRASLARRFKERF